MSNVEQEKKLESPLDIMRHSTAHVLAAAILKLFPEAKFGIGPVVKNGFYYDLELDRTLSTSDFSKIEKQMRRIIRENHPFDRISLSIETAREKFDEFDQKYKVEIIDDLKKAGKSEVSLYKTGAFTDLCRGPHVDSSGEIPVDAFKLMKVAGAYWKGDEKREQLQRIYGVSFETKEELEKYLKQQEEAEKRDHRKLGKELDLFSFSPLVGTGLPLWSPKGTIIRNELQNALLEISKKYNMLPVTIPHIAKRALYETSGHAQKFGEELIKVVSHYDEFVMKPVNCPHHTQIYASKPRSYRDLPIRYMESTMQYRDEKPGEIGGLTRVRAITVDDGHIFCRVDQIKEEAKNIAKIIEEFYTGIGLFGNHWVSLSVRDPETPDAYIGNPEDWDAAENMLQEISDDLKLNAKRVEGEAALYGPKLDYMFKDSLGREQQLATIQLDFSMPKRFELTYIDNEGKEATPVMIHRAILGSYERFLAILIEHFAGVFPTWLSPTQVVIIPISEKFNEYGKKVYSRLKEGNIRVELDTTDISLGKRISNARKQKTPYMLIVGGKEEESETVAVRSREDGDIGAISVEEFLNNIKEEIKEKK